MNQLRLGWLALFAISGLVTLGCSSSSMESTNAPPVAADDLEHIHDDHDGHGHPENYADAVTALESISDEIRESLAKGDMDAADGPVHEIGHVLEDIGPFAKEAGLSEADQTTVDEAVGKLLDAFGVVDKKIHAAETASYDDIADVVSESLGTLKKFSGSAE